KILITISFLFSRGCFCIFADEGDSMLMNVVQFPRFFRKTKVLSSIHPCFDTHYRCCCRKKPNQDDSEEVIVLEFQVLFRYRKVISDTRPCCYTPKGLF